MSPIDTFLRDWQRTPQYIANATRSVSPPDEFKPHECPTCKEEVSGIIRCEECRVQHCKDCTLEHDGVFTCRKCAPVVAASDAREIELLHARRQALLAFASSVAEHAKVVGGLALVALVCVIGAAL